jgi:N-acetyl-gamma-glutamyl-phosphate reductase
MRAVVLGGSGYAGGELLRLIATHPHLKFVAASGEGAAGEPVGNRLGELALSYAGTAFVTHDEAAATAADVVFLALPHGHSARYAPGLAAAGRVVVDLGADFRLTSAQEYARWYGAAHEAPEWLGRFVYALVERHRAELAGATLLAVPGCYPTAAALALGPFLDAGWIKRDGIIVNALSGTSGAGRGLRDDLSFSELHGNARAYGLLHHRHTVEMAQELSASLLFTPHLVPMSRGLLVTAYGATTSPRRTEDAVTLLRAAYRQDPFVNVTSAPPTVKAVVGSNVATVSAAVDERTGWLVAMAAIDNLGKGAAGQAIQALNVAMGWAETSGLAMAGIAP